jgi:hypothetical protein
LKPREYVVTPPSLVMTEIEKAGRDAALAAINNNADNDFSEGIMNLTNAGKK